MKKRVLILMCFLFASTALLKAQAPCDAVTAEAFAMDPQSGAHNYFGVRVTLAQAYSQDVAVSGYIFDDGNGGDTNHPFTLTITAGNLTAETEATFYQTDPTAIAAVSISSVTPCPGNGLGDFSDDYVKRHVALIDAYVRSISSSSYVREMYFKNYGNDVLPSVMSYGDDLFFDDGTNNDAVAGDGIYTSTDAYAHTTTVPYTNLMDISVSTDYAVVDNIFEHETALQNFLQTYQVPTRDGSVAKSVKYYQYDEPVLNTINEGGKTINDFHTNIVTPSYEEDFQQVAYQYPSKEDNIEIFKFKASIKCDVGSCSCASCNCRACRYNWGQRLNWCFYVKNCSVEIGFE